MRKLLSVLLVLTMVLGLWMPVMAAEGEKSDDIVILYTNDVHTYIDGSLSYDVIAALKDDLQEKYNHVLLVDAGDHIQGTAYGSMDKGKTIIDLMNAADYDLATLGNHEFDYGMEGRINVTDVWAEYPYVSCNFYHEEDGVRGENVLPGYELFTCGEMDVAFVGITTPSTFTSSTPAYFQDEEGNYIYGISGGIDGSALYEDVQTAIDDAVEDGAEIVLALGHLGVEMEGDPWGSVETIKNVSGLDAFIDGHSHTIMEGQLISDKDGEEVLLTQTGEYFGRIGIMVIDAETGAIETDFIEYDEAAGGLSSQLYAGTQLLSDSTVEALKQSWMEDVNGLLGEKIGTAEVTLHNYDEDGNRLVRSQETNSGDFSADALYYLFDEMNMDVDMAVMNGGGVRNGAITGELSYLSCKEIHTFGNVACLLTVTGQQVLDALEWGARAVGVAEEGSFLHVSGLTYKIDTSIPNTTTQDEKGVWTGGPDQYRVHDVKVYNQETDSWDDLQLDKEYNMAGYNYTLRDLGGGFAMLEGAVNVLDYVMEDYMVLAEYVKGFENATVKADNSPLLQKYPGFLLDYSDVSGSGRIVCETVAEDAPCVSVYTDYECTINGVSAKELQVEPGTPVEIIVDTEDELHGFMGTEGDPEPGNVAVNDGVVTFTMPEENVYINISRCLFGGYQDLDADAWYHPYVYYALETGLMVGTGPEKFDPEGVTSRAMLVTMLWRAEGKPQAETTGTFTDVRAGAYYEKAVEWAAAEGIVQGIGGGRFAPDRAVTRQEAATILWRFMGSPQDASGDLDQFPDGKEVSSWAKAAMEWAVGEGLIIGDRMGGQNWLNPQAESSRAVTATLMMRFLQNRVIQ